MTATEEAHAYSLEEGVAAVRAARAVVEAAARGEKRQPAVELPEKFARQAGVFTTLTTHPHGELRGCVGFAEPVLPLREAIAASAAAAALEDGRFHPVEPMELDQLIVELSLLTPPKWIDAKDPKEIEAFVQVGRHGLIVRDGKRGGLLLPQVATDWGWSAREFLEHTCQKAGLDPEFWKNPRATILSFEAEIFREDSPRGTVSRHEQHEAAKGN